jgi:hypothetical protein
MRYQSHWTIAAVYGAALIVGCVRRENASRTGPSQGAQTQGDVVELGTRHVALQDLQLRLESPASARVGDRIVFRLVVNNTGSVARRLTLAGRETTHANFVVVGRDGAEVWSNLFGVITLGTEITHTIQPGASIHFQAEWDGRPNGGSGQPVNGVFFVRGMLRPTTFGPPIETPLRQLNIGGGPNGGPDADLTRT